MSFTASDVLLKAASRIEEEGMWCQGTFFELDGVQISSDQAFTLRQTTRQRVPECALGALISAAVEMDLSFTMFENAQEMLESELGLRHGSCWVGEWNDNPDRNAHEVADAMRRAAL